MRRYYLVVDFHTPHLLPHAAGGRGVERFQSSPHYEMYRDVDKDPGTLVAVSADRTFEYPWSEVKQAVVAPPVKAAKP